MLRLIPLALYMGVIFYVSSRPAPSAASLEVGPGLVLGDLGHIGAYAILALLSAWAFPGWRRTGLRLFALFVFAAAYGLSDEFHQSFVPGREASWYDVALDASGAAVALLLIGFWERLSRKDRHL